MLFAVAKWSDHSGHASGAGGSGGAGAEELTKKRMLSFPAALRIYLAVEPVDMRKQFNGLWTLALEKFKEDPRCGALFVFVNKDKDRLKMLTSMALGLGFLPSAWRRGDLVGRHAVRMRAPPP